MDYQQSSDNSSTTETETNGDAAAAKAKSIFDERTEEASASQYFQFYGYLAQQQNMMQDFVRTSTYQKAVLSNLTDFKDKIVLDVGAGSGILSFFAAQAGAKHVYAVEASSMALHCEALVKANGMEKRITVIPGKIEDIKLPDMVDTIISEPMGYMLLNERMLESFLHAKKFLRPGGKMYPSRGDLHIAPFCDEALYMEQCTKANFWCQESFHGVNLLSLRQQALKEYFRQPVVDTFHVGILLAPSVQWTLDFSKRQEEDLYRIEIPLEFVITQTSYIHGLAFWFDVAFIGANQTVWLSTAPTEPLTHWYQVRCLLEKPILCRQGGTVTGHVYLTANKRQSYDVDIMLQCEGISASGDDGSPSMQVSKNTLDLKNPCFRYTGQPVQPPPGHQQPAMAGNGASGEVAPNLPLSAIDAYYLSTFATEVMQPPSAENGTAAIVMNGIGNNGIALPTTTILAAGNRGMMPMGNLPTGVPTIASVASLLPTGQSVQSPMTNFAPQGSSYINSVQQPASPHYHPQQQMGATPCLSMHHQSPADYFAGDHAGMAASNFASSANDTMPNQQHYTYQTAATSTSSNQSVLKS